MVIFMLKDTAQQCICQNTLVQKVGEKNNTDLKYAMLDDWLEH